MMLCLVNDSRLIFSSEKTPTAGVHLHRRSPGTMQSLQREREFSLAADLVRRCGLDELDELEGLGRTVATVHLARELNE